MEGWLDAWGGLTWDDVIKVEVPSTTASYESVLEGVADVSYIPISSGAAYKLEASPHGVRWLEVPADEKEKWATFTPYSPNQFPLAATVGVHASEETPVWVCGQVLPAIYALPETPNDVAYWTTKAIFESYDLYKDAIAGMHVDFDLARWVEEARCITPWHEGSIQYLKEAGLWSERLEKAQPLLLERQEELARLWAATIEKATEMKLAHTDYPALWEEARQEKFGDQWYFVVD